MKKLQQLWWFWFK